MDPLNFPTSADAVDSGVLRVKTRAVVPAIAIAPAPIAVAPVPVALAPVARPATVSGFRSWWWLLLLAGGYYVWRKQSKRRGK
jgi:hypothetical protein